LKLRTILGLGLGCLLCAYASPLSATPNSGKISGVVLDPSGTAQMGASVVITAERVFGDSQLQLLTNARGRFSTSALPAGPYSIKVTLAGFLPAIEQHIEVTDERTTLLEVVLGSVFSSFEKLRQQPNQRADKDDWTWVLRSSAATRSVMQWQDPRVVVLGQESQETEASAPTTRGQVLLSSGGDHPGSIGAQADSPSTAFAYDMGMGNNANLVMAGQFSYERGAGAESFAGEWLPPSRAGVGPVTTLMVRQSQLGPSGPVFRGLRMSHNDQLALSDRVSVRYGGEIVAVGFMGKTTTTLSPRGEVDVQLARDWKLAGIVAAHPWESAGAATTTDTDSALNTLDAFPTVLLRRGRPLTEDNLHEEIAVEHVLGQNARVSAAFFHDASNHTAVMGVGGAANAPDFLQDYFSQAFAYDGGSSSSSGARVAYQQKLSNDVDTVLVYAYGGALAPDGRFPPDGPMRSQLSTEARHSVAARASATLPALGTRFTAGYKWISGPVVSQQDTYGQSSDHIAPYLSAQIHQPLPAFFFAGHMQIEADAGNLLAQGYVPLATSRGKVILVPSCRYFRGGLSFQF
jgi:hypothetical protein